MSIATFRISLRPQRNLWSGVLFAVVAVAAIVTGLLAMHSLNLEHSMGTNVGSSSMVAQHHEQAMADGAAHDVASEPCGDPCMPNHSLSAMACILALLVSALLVGTARMVTGRHFGVSWISSSARMAVAIRLPEPPSLHDLCISRT
ncbi:MAG: DUF6153 family protein [Microbacteriaceae bacterium]